MKKYNEYFYGNKVSEYGLRNGYVDYRTLAKAFDAVLCNAIVRLFDSEVNGEYNPAEQVNGFIDNSEEVEELEERIEEMQTRLEGAEEIEDSDTVRECEESIEEMQERIGELNEEEPAEVFQYYIISDNGADILCHDTNEIVYYLPAIDLYVWGVTHYGTAWDYVLTDIKLDEVEE